MGQICRRALLLDAAQAHKSQSVHFLRFIDVLL